MENTLLLRHARGNYLPHPYDARGSTAMRLTTLIFPAAVLVLALLAGPAFAASSSRLPVVVSIAPQKYMLERVAGEAVSVSVLLKPGSDPHAYEPGPAQMRDVASAAAWFTIGVPFEAAWQHRISGAIKNLRVIPMEQSIRRLAYGEPVRTIADLHKALIELGKHQHRDQRHDFTLQEGTEAFQRGENGRNGARGNGHAEDDPHVWLSPAAVRAMLPGLVRDLASLMPGKEEAFKANAKLFDDELEALDGELEERFGKVPPLKRVFLSFHPSWGYYAHNYQLIELSIEADGKEPGPRSLKAITDMAKKLGITTVFVEPQFPKASAKAIADTIGASLVEADPLEEDLLSLYRRMADKLLASFNHD